MTAPESSPAAVTRAALKMAQQAESETLRSQCRETISRLFPDSGDIRDCNPSDVMELTAIFQRNRFYSLEQLRRLQPATVLYALNKLITHVPFQSYHNDTGLIDLRRYLSLLAEALRSFRNERIALQHNVRDTWYNGINRLSDISERASQKCPRNLQVELWDVKFLLVHCQYLLLSIRNSYSSGELIVETGGQLAKARLSADDNQYVDAVGSSKDIINRKQSRAKWHDDYITLEEMHFKSLARGLDKLVEERTSSTDWDAEELKLTITLRDKLEKELKDSSHRSNATRPFKNVFRKKTQSSGPSEENSHYFAYGLLDLMYQLSFWASNRRPCFGELVGAVKRVLEWSPQSAHPLHDKAIDIYRRIDYLGEGGRPYGTVQERQSIEDWIKQHFKQVEIQTDLAISDK